MARLSKAHHFKIFEDAGIPTPPADENDPFDDTTKPSCPSVRSATFSVTPRTGVEHTATDYDPLPDADNDTEALPRDSLTSVSSFPESASQHNDADYTHVPPASPQKFFTPQIIRPSFRRPESVRRMQLSSPRQSILSYYRSSRSGTPRSEFGKGSPRGRRRITEESTSEEERAPQDQGKTHPLVLLHMTLLPIVLPWSTESMQEILPEHVLKTLMSLRSKVSDTVLQRGILIPHPREEYEMLEERLLEALELKQERVTKCGHYRGRASTSSQESSGRESDSGLGSSESGSESSELCATCQHHIRCVAGKKSKWSVKVFAANGLMRSSAWAAAWSEMESVDVEILPWISEEDRRKLDLRRDEEEKRVREFPEDGDAGMREAMFGDTMRALSETRQIEAGEASGGATIVQNPGATSSATTPPATFEQLEEPSKGLTSTYDLPPVYRSSQVPLSVLLRNYCYLLAQDRRNVVAFFLGILAIFFAVRSMASVSIHALAPIDDHTVTAEPASTVTEEQSAVELGTQDIDVPEAQTQFRDGPSMLENFRDVVSEIVEGGSEAVFEMEAQPVTMASEDVVSDGLAQQDTQATEDPEALE